MRSMRFSRRDVLKASAAIGVGVFATPLRAAAFSARVCSAERYACSRGMRCSSAHSSVHPSSSGPR